MHNVLSNSRHLLGVSCIKRPKWNFMRITKIQNTTDSNCIVSHSQNTKELQLNTLWTGTLLLLVSHTVVGFPQGKQRPRSTADSVVSNNNTYDEEVLIYANLKLTHDCTVQRGR
jgi:hypothetical protein